ncbi:tripartite tricarboxylate transporter substrate-binding protein [Cupriavidus sp. UME77]|uniref:tripartite tricarboxylate transporter substrate-binding protein n=1 Tax=Cupriavidus sp. UME77 TaxID=1862321 RepID=UPI001604429C|nr:tripartite tricarboxylate transporter substrate-binding protein [Cupriavidus sp. UME77]MBB1634486.1 ABC transporter substrate-binding protein [Cupriavidus sp. UME77]
MRILPRPKTVLLLGAMTASLLAQAQDSAPIKILVGFAPGGVTDILARLVADKLRAELNQPVVVENKAGAGSRLANQALKASAPDGHTFMIAPNSGPVFLDILYPRSALGYDLLTDLAPVATLTTYPFGMVVQRNLGVKNAQEYVAWAKANPSQAVFGSSGAGSHTHFIGAKLSQAAGIHLQVIPYKGDGQVNVDLMAGHLPAAIMAAADFMRHKNNPKLQILGIFSPQRSPLAPDVPTFAEQGLKFNVGEPWMGMWTSAKTPKADVERMQNALRKILATPEMKESLQTTLTMAPLYRSATEMDKLQRAELEMWRPIIKQSGFTPDQ